MNLNKVLWEKGDFIKLVVFMCESGDVFVELLGVMSGLKIFDFGCGDGMMVLFVVVCGVDVLGVDIVINFVVVGKVCVVEVGLFNFYF